MYTAKLIFPHQLFKINPLFSHIGDTYLIEEQLFFTQYNFHKQKIALHRASMKYYEHFLLNNKEKVHYIAAQLPEADVRILIEQLYDKNISAIYIINPVDDWLLQRIRKTCQKFNIQLHIEETPMFLNTAAMLSDFFKASKKKFFQTEFYKQQRISRNILIDGLNNPSGGKWSFDEENRKKFPKGKKVVQIDFPKGNTFSTEAKAYTKQHFVDNIGQLSETINYPIGFEESEQWLEQFLQKRFAEFGDYEDAIVQQESILNHSVLTPMLNVGMLTPSQIITAALNHAKLNDTPINSVEGFVRQIIGWREFIRGVYEAKGGQQRNTNYWGFTKKIPQSFYTGTTGILPIDATIKKVLKTGYCHHIERLMVLGNFMVLCEFDPNEVYQWFMELFIDAYDWVMVPNVYGMSQFADGGLMATKPYISGSNYLSKMSDYPKGEWQQIWDALFWRFLAIHREFFMKNPRLSMLVKSFDKWDKAKQQTVYTTAENYLATLA